MRFADALDGELPGDTITYIPPSNFICNQGESKTKRLAHTSKRKHKLANGLVRFQCSVPMYVRVLKLKKVTAYEKQMLCVALSFKRQGDSSYCRGTWYSVFIRPLSAVLLYHLQETFVKVAHKVHG